MKQLFIFLSGLGIGAAGAYFYTKNKYEKQATEEIDQMRKYYKEKEAEILNEVNEELHEEAEAKLRPEHTKPSLKELMARYTSQEDEEPEEEDELDELEKPEVTGNADPEFISVQEFSEAPSNFDETEWTYYDETDTWEDENGEPVDSPEDFLGKCYDEIINDAGENYFVRNYRMAMDYHITKVF